MATTPRPLLQVLHAKPISVAAGAVYPYNPSLVSACERQSKYDADEKFNLCRVVGTEFQKRIWVPRNMAPEITVDLRADGLDYQFNSTFVPRNEEQSRVISESSSLLLQGISHILEAPTGFGKTWCASDLISRVKKKTIIVVTKEDILDQWVAAIEKLLSLQVGKGIGIVGGNRCDVINRPVVIAMVQSIAKDGRYPEHTFKDFGLAVFDECHRMGADFFSQACFRVPAKLRLGISATPDRKDGREEVLLAHIGRTMVKTEAAPSTPRVTMQESPWQIPLKRKLDKEGRIVMNEDNTVAMVQLPHSPGKCGHIVRMLSHHYGRNAMIANFVKQAYDAGRKVLVQSDTKDHLETLSALISSSGVPTPKITYYVGGMASAAREKAKLGQIIMATYQMTAEATDIPTLDTLVMATPKSDVRQIVGRILRAFEGKKEPLVFDIVDSSSSVFSGYAKNRKAWYGSVGAKVTSLPAPRPIDKLLKPNRMVGT